VSSAAVANSRMPRMWALLSWTVYGVPVIGLPVLLVAIALYEAMRRASGPRTASRSRGMTGDRTQDLGWSGEPV
jgi:hypothetical protein